MRVIINILIFGIFGGIIAYIICCIFEYIKFKKQILNNENQLEDES